MSEEIDFKLPDYTTEVTYKRIGFIMSASTIQSPQHTPPFPCHPGPSIPIDGFLLTEEQVHLGKESTKGGRSCVAIDMLPDIALLDIFEFYMNGNRIEAWQILVHVCKNWRTVVFGSPRRLDLRLLCMARTPVGLGEMLDIWPLLPIVVRVEDDEEQGMDNIIAALGHYDRICQLNLEFLTEDVLAAMQKPFPILTRLNLSSSDNLAPIDPDLFLGGSSPHLQTLILYNISFQGGLPKLLLSATQLVLLDLWYIRPSGFISPEIMLSCLFALTRLETLKIGFKYLQSRSNLRDENPPSLPRILLPVLTELRFKGLPEYTEFLVARIDAPLLDNLNVSFFFYEPIITSSQLNQFIDRTPKLKAHNQVRVVIDPDSDAWVTLPQTHGGRLRLKIICTDGPSEQLSSVAQFCSSSIPRTLIFAVECLYIAGGGFHVSPFEGEVLEDSLALWLELLRPFTAVKRLYISREFTPRLVLALQELVGERLTEVLPTLQTLFLEEPEELGNVQEGIGQFVAARQVIDRRVTLSHWNGIKDVSDEMED